MRPPIDVAVVAQDPWYGGGALRHLDAFRETARALGREPTTLYLSREHVVSPRRPRAALTRPPDGAYRSLLPEADALNQLLAARMAPRVRAARSAWVVASAAYYGAGALRSGRPYACWIGSGAASEWSGRLAGGLPRSRRLALRLGAPALLRLERAVVRGAQAAYAVSPAAQRTVAAAAGVPPERVRVLPLPIDLERFRPEPDDAWLARLEAPTIAFVGRGSDPRKNVGLLLAAFERLRRDHPPARLRLVGAPPRHPLPEGVELVGETAAVAEAIRGCTVLVLPSFQESFGIVVAEALASGVPAVVTPCDGPEDLIRASGAGIVLGGFDAGELTATLGGLLGDPERLLELRRRGRPYVEREHSPERLRELLAAAFAELDG